MFIRSGKPSPSPSNSAMSSNAKSTKIEGISVSLKIIEPSSSITLWGMLNVPEESETPASKTILLLSPGRPASIKLIHLLGKW